MKLTEAVIKTLLRLYHSRSNQGETGVPLQSGVLPWRMKRRKKAEVMLVTSRRGGRWMIPKGWPMVGMSLADSAAREAFEEAGIKGKIDPEPIGTFRHVKQHVLLGSMEVDILVHALAVEDELRDWPERGQRARKWFGLKAAAETVESKELRKLIVQLGKRLNDKPKKDGKGLAKPA